MRTALLHFSAAVHHAKKQVKTFRRATTSKVIRTLKMAALIKPMCGLKNFRQFPGLVGFYLQNYVDSAKTPTLKIERLRHLPNKHCKCSYSTGTSSKSVTDEILSSKLSESEKTEEQQSGSDNSKENEEEKKLKMKKLMKRVYICSAVFGTGMFISLVNRWGNVFVYFLFTVDLLLFLKKN